MSRADEVTARARDRSPSEPTARRAETWLGTPSASEVLERDLITLTEAGAGPHDGEIEWRQLVETLPQIVWITRPDGWHTHFNQQWMDFTGLTLEESLGHGWNPPFHPDDRGRAAARWDQATSSGEPYEIEYRLRRADGVYRWMLGRAMPLRDASGAIVKWFGTCTDIEDLKRAQAQLEQSRTLHRLAGSMARLGGWSIDVSDARMAWSEQMYEILEYPADEEPDLAESIELVLPEYRSRLESAITACADAGTPFDLEVEQVTYAGRRLWVRVMGEARYRPDGTVSHVHGALQDITALKESVREKEVLAERLTTTVESITDAFLTLDRDWRFTYVNRQAEQLLQRTRDELLGRRIWDEYPPVLGTELERAYRRAMDEQVTVGLDEYYYPPLDMWLQIDSYPSEQGLAVNFRDVSDQHRAQEALHDANVQLEAAARLKDDLLSMASHELRTPLTPILGFLELLESRGDNLSDEQQRMLQVMGSNARRMLRLVDDLLVVSRATAGVLVSRPEEIAAHDLVLPVLDELGDVLAGVEVDLDDCQVVGDPQHLQQVIVNLLTNASKYGAAPIVVSAAAVGADRVVLEVADRGEGVPRSFQSRMWDRFVQKDRGDARTATGVGLGLSIVRLLVDANGGTVGYRDGDPSGAVFSVELPGRVGPGPR